jgi:hypothetical protein
MRRLNTERRKDIILVTADAVIIADGELLKNGIP